MLKKLSVVFFVLCLAFGILFISLFRVASVKYEFRNSPPMQDRIETDEESLLDYYLPYPGRVLPDNVLWPLKALRDRVWFFVTPNPTRRIELLLLFADKRLGMAKILFEKGKMEEGFSTLTKAEKYLEKAVWLEEESRRSGVDTIHILQTLSQASLKHYEVMEKLKKIAPDEVRPEITKTQDYAKRSYEQTRNALLEKGFTPPENPFVW